MIVDTSLSTGLHNLGNVFLLGLEEVLGASACRSILVHPCLAASQAQSSLANEPVISLESVTNLETSLKAKYGAVQGQGLAVRTGRAAFKYLLRNYGADLGITSLEFRMTPVQKRINAGLTRLADLIKNQTGQLVSFEAGNNQLIWRLEGNPGKPGSSNCHLLGGLLQESLTWMSTGKSYAMEEMACISRGDPACTLLFRSYVNH